MHRLGKRIYTPLPEPVARRKLINRLMSTLSDDLTDADRNAIVALAGGYSSTVL